MLQGSDILTILAEIFVAFAGFTGIVAVLGQRSEGEWRPIDVIRFHSLLEASLAGLLLSVLPFSSFYFGVADTDTWRFGSAFMAIYLVFVFYKTIRKHQKLGASDDPDYVPGARLSLLILAIPVLAVLTLNALGIGLHHTFPGYLVGLIYTLILCCAMFILLLRFVRADA
jgi:hypothetical protein